MILRILKIIIEYKGCCYWFNDMSLKWVIAYIDNWIYVRMSYKFDVIGVRWIWYTIDIIYFAISSSTHNNHFLRFLMDNAYVTYMAGIVY
jgi:hypothetical protein